MKSKDLIISTALVFMLVGIVGTAQAKTLKLHCTRSGTFADGTETSIDTNDDGVSATFSQGILNCNNGRFFVSEESEPVFRDVNVTCPQGSLEAFIDPTHGQGLSVATDEKTGDQLFSKVTSSTTCANIDFSKSPPFPVTISQQFEYTGGTGKFAGASGTAVSQLTASLLVIGFKNGIFGDFAQFTGTIDTTLTLPKDNQD